MLAHLSTLWTAWGRRKADFLGMKPHDVQNLLGCSPSLELVKLIAQFRYSTLRRWHS
jgi:hypothetical protein